MFCDFCTYDSIRDLRKKFGKHCKKSKLLILRLIFMRINNDDDDDDDDDDDNDDDNDNDVD